MFPVTEDKFLLKFVGKTLLEHRIKQALAVGLSNIILVGNHQNIERLEGIARRFSQVHIALTSQGEPSGMADALMSAQHLVEDEIIVVSPGDVFDESGYRNVLVEKNRGLASSFILGAKVDKYFTGGYLVFDEGKEIPRILEKPGEGAEPSNVVNIAVYLHTDVEALFRHLAKVASKG